MLQLEHIVKKYHGYTAVRELSFSVEKGQILGLLGLNGAGKSTTMNMIAGYFAPTAGRILWNGQDVRSLGADYLSEVGYLPEVPPLYPELTVRESLEYACAIRRIRRDKRRSHIRQVCEMARVEDCLNTPTRSLSKGYRQRVGLAQALIGNPGLIMLDEPTAGLDPEQIIAIRELIRALGRDHAVILSSHILSEIEDVCSSLLILRRGHTVACGTMSEIAAQARPEGCRVRLRARGEHLRETLLALPGVTALSHLPEREQGWGEWLLEADRDVTALLAPAISGSGAEMRMLYPQDVELEDVFMKLMQEEGDA